MSSLPHDSPARNTAGYRLPPQNLDAERGLLGAIIRDPSIVTEAIPKIDRADYFFADAHQEIFRAMLSLYTTGRNIDLVTLAEQLKRRGKLDDVRMDYIADLLDAAPTAANWREYVGIVREAWAARRVLHIANEMMRDVYDSQDASAILDRGQRALAGIASTAGGLSERPLRWPAPLYASELPDDGPEFDFLLDGYIARGHLTVFIAVLKCGKSTWLGHLFRALQSGSEFAGRKTQECRTLVVSEETTSAWRKRRNVLGLDDHLSIMSKPTMAKLTFAEWIDFVDEIGKHAEKRGIDLVVIDTVTAFAPWKNENDNAEIMEAITPLNRLTKAGLAVMLVHHAGKIDHGQGLASRGGTSLPGAADCTIEMRRYDINDINDRRRVLACRGRLEDEPSESVIELATDGSGYHACGSKRDAEARELFDAIEGVLPITEPGVTAEQAHASLPSDKKPSRGQVGKVLKEGANSNRWRSSGSGKKGDPYLFWKNKS